MKKLDLSNEKQYIYVGSFDLPNATTIVSINIPEKVEFDIRKAVNSFQEIENKISLSELKKICADSNIKATIYPNGNVGFRKLDSSNDELKTCYLSLASTEINNYLICIAFEETQPTLYKGQLVSIFLLDKTNER